MADVWWIVLWIAALVLALIACGLSIYKVGVDVGYRRAQREAEDEARLAKMREQLRS